jgi:hypothetical protein
MQSPSINRRQVLHALVTAGAAAAVLAGPKLPRAAAAAERHPHIRSSLKELREAKKELEKGDKIFGGHRVKAIKAVEDAIEQLQAALDFAEKN